MIRKFALSGICILSLNVFGNELEVEITSLTNVKGNGAMEACGVIKNYTGKTSIVTISHDESVYTTLTDDNGKWCQIVKRWTFNGRVNAVAREL